MGRRFNAAGERITWVTSDNADTQTTISFAAWIYAVSGGLDAGDPYGRIIQKAGRFTCYTDDDGDPTVGFTAAFSGSSGDWAPATGSISLSTWTHVVFTYNSSSTSNDPIIYVNGTSLALTNYDTNPTGTVNADAATITVGNVSSGTATFDGYIAEAGYWNKILSQAEVTELAAGDSPSHYVDNLKFYCPLLGTSSSEIDQVTGRVGTITGADNASSHPTITYPTQTSPRYIIQGGI